MKNKNILITLIMIFVLLNVAVLSYNMFFLECDYIEVMTALKKLNEVCFLIFGILIFVKIVLLYFNRKRKNTDAILIERYVKVSNNIFPLIASIIMATIHLGVMVFLLLYVIEDFSFLIFVYLFLEIFTLGFIIISLFLEKGKNLVYLIGLQAILGVVALLLFPDMLQFKKVFLIDTVLLVFIIIAQYKFRGRGIKKPFYILFGIITLIYLYLIFFSYYYDFNLGFLSIYAYINSYVYLLFYLSVVYWLFNPYRYVNESKIWEPTFNDKIIMGIESVIICFSVIFMGINIYMSPFRWTDEAINNFQRISKIENEQVLEMLETLEFDGEHFTLPYKVADLPNDFQVIEGFPTTIVIYDVQCILTYKGEYIAYLTKTPESDRHSQIFEMSFNSDLENAEKFTFSGVGLGSTEQDLLRKFPSYTEMTSDYEKDSTIIRYGDYDFTDIENESIVFFLEDGIIKHISIYNGAIH